MEPQIQYAKTSDGVSIAFTTVGEGTPLVVAGDISDTHVQLVWDSPFGTRLKTLAQRHTVVKFDPRGFGLSEREVTDFSIEKRLLDLEAVVNHLELDRFPLIGFNTGGPLAVVFAARNPNRASALILHGSPVRTAETFRRHRASQLATLIDSDWEMFLENLAAVNVGYGREEATRNAKLLAAAIDRETFKRWAAAAARDDVTNELGNVQCATLVLHYTGVHYLDQETARELASGIPDARLIVLEGNWLDGMQAATDGILEFLGDEPSDDAHEGDRAGSVHTILFTDVEGSTPLTERLGDAKARELLREHEGIVREALKAHGGSEVKTMGDGFMASFSSATKALECAIAIQTAFAERNESADEPIKVRIGLNAGEPIAEDDPDGRSDLFGTTVNLAARICAHAEAGQILAPIVVRELVAGKGFLFSDRGETEMRGFEDPVRIYELRWERPSAG